VLFVAAALVAACNRSASLPPPSEVPAEATGYYCGMPLVNHEGPKGQVHLASRKDPLWFSSVRDTVAFMRQPQEPRDITAVYVNDMARAKHWEQPEAGAWVEPRKAWFVIDSDMRGGMGAPEVVPFSDWALAESFTATHRGRVVRLGDIPDAYVRGQANLPGAGASRPSR
jgi:copper chaperone NosL